MSTPYPPQPRRLMRDPSNKLIGGVCSGVAKYLNMDVNLVRILTVLISLFTGVPIILYIIALFVMPEERAEQQPPYVNGPQPGGYGAQAYQQHAAAPGQAPGDDVWGPSGAPWEQRAGSGSAAPAPSPAPAPQPWQQPPATAASSFPGDEPTRYDTSPATGDAPAPTPATPEANLTDASVPAGPATAVPEEPPAAAPDPEPVPETGTPEVPADEASAWESAPADPGSSEDPSNKT